MSQFNSIPSQQIDTVYRSTNNTIDMSFNDTIVHSVTLRPVQDSVVGYAKDISLLLIGNLSGAIASIFNIKKEGEKQ